MPQATDAHGARTDAQGAKTDAQGAQSEAQQHGRPRRSMLTLWILLAACVLPFVAATLLFIFAPPQSTMNYGEVIEPRPLTEFSAERVEGGRFTLADLKGEWTMVHHDGAECAA